jgi:peptidoglycan/LPS O-acetylase OafA/YrhL
VAILLVMLLHFGGSETDPTLGSTPLPLLGKLYLRVADAGGHGVDLFFVLSGFLITGILYDAKGKPHYFRTFFMRRVLRIFPLYYGVLFAVFVPLHVINLLGLAPWPRSTEQEWGLWLYCTNVVMALRDTPVYDSAWLPLSHFWSLAVEEHFYLIWPAVIFAFGRRVSISICLACVASAIGFRAWLLSHGGSAFAAAILTPCRMDALALGALLALLVRGPGGQGAARRWGWAFLAAGAASLVALRLAENVSAEVAGFATPVRMSMIALFFAGVVALAVGPHRIGLSGLLGGNVPLKILGKYSYGLYVFHYALRPVCRWLFPASHLSAWTGTRLGGLLLHATLAIALSLALAWLSWHLCEKHFLKLKRFFPTSSGA